MYFDQLLSAALTQKLVELLFSAVFKLFCSFYTFFSDFTPEINKKRLKINKNKVFFLLKAGRHAKACWLLEELPWNHLFLVDFFHPQPKYQSYSWTLRYTQHTTHNSLCCETDLTPIPNPAIITFSTPTLPKVLLSLD